jgi:hypothetical protein
MLAECQRAILIFQFCISLFYPPSTCSNPVMISIFEIQPYKINSIYRHTHLLFIRFPCSGGILRMIIVSVWIKYISNPWFRYRSGVELFDFISCSVGILRMIIVYFQFELNIFQTLDSGTSPELNYSISFVNGTIYTHDESTFLRFNKIFRIPSYGTGPDLYMSDVDGSVPYLRYHIRSQLRFNRAELQTCQRRT